MKDKYRPIGAATFLSPRAWGPGDRNVAPPTGGFWRAGVGSVLTWILPTLAKTGRRSADFQSAVSRVSNPLGTEPIPTRCRLEVGDTAGWKPALRAFGTPLLAAQLALLAFSAGAAAETDSLRNDALRADFDGRGLVAIVDNATSKTIRFAQDGFSVFTRTDAIESEFLKPVVESQSATSRVYRFESAPWVVKVVYPKRSSWVGTTRTARRAKLRLFDTKDREIVQG